MRKHTKRKVWPLRAPGLPLTDEHQRELALQLHVAAARLDTVEGCNSFTRMMMVTTIAMEISKTHDDHSRALLRTCCLKLEPICAGRPMDDATMRYCQQVASWIDEWIVTRRFNYASFIEAKQIAKEIDKQPDPATS